MVAPASGKTLNGNSSYNSASDTVTESDQDVKLDIAPQPSSTHRAPLGQSHSQIKRDAEAYGIKWKAPKEFGFWNPQQAKEKHLMWLKLLGRVGWAAKAVIYALLGGLACDNAVGDENASASPQFFRFQREPKQLEGLITFITSLGAFVLIGTANGGRGALVVLAIATATYSAWRYWEGIVGQGYDDSFGKWKNFFKFRLSPFVSGSVYVAYDVLIITTIPRDDDQQRNSLRNSRWPNNWRGTNIGKAAICIVGIAFVAATIVQIEQFLTKSFHNTIKHEFKYMRPALWKSFRIFVLMCGHLGVLGRAGIFAFAAVLFFRTLHKDTYSGKSAFGDAFAQLQGSKAGKAALFIMGFLVIVYALFALLNVYARYFPTPPPTGVKKISLRPAGDDAILPQYAGGNTGFAPMGTAPSSEQPHHPHSYLSPLHNAAASHHPQPGSKAAEGLIVTPIHEPAQPLPHNSYTSTGYPQANGGRNPNAQAEIGMQPMTNHHRARSAGNV